MWYCLARQCYISYCVYSEPQYGTILISAFYIYGVSKELLQDIFFADEMSRVILRTTGQPGSDYINGSFINVGANNF